MDHKIGMDLLEWKGSSYLVIVDYYSRYIELVSLTSSSTINHLKSIFARHGVPETVMSDNGPQYTAAVFKEFAKEYSFTHVTSSPKFPQSNGAVERAVKTVKGLLNKNEDPYLALISYRSTPLENGYSPAELLMSRKIQTPLPILPSQLKPKLPKIKQLRKRRIRYKVG